MILKYSRLFFQTSACILLLSILAPGAPGQGNLPRTATYQANGEVKAIAATSGKIYLGGKFSALYLHVGPGVPVNTAAGKALGAFPRIVGYAVFTCVADGSGGWYVGGRFDKVGAYARVNIAHILANGSVDAAWDPNPQGVADEYGSVYGYISVIERSGSTLYVGGRFSAIGGQKRNYVAALDAATGKAKAWNPNANADVTAIALAGTTVYAGGDFTTLGGQTRNHLAALDASTGALKAWNPNVKGVTRYGEDPDLPNVPYEYTSIGALLVSGSTVYVGGVFSAIGGVARNDLAALDAATGKPTAWDARLKGVIRHDMGNHAYEDAFVQSLALSGTTLYLGGTFASVGGQPRNGLAALDTASATPKSWNPSPKQADRLSSPTIEHLALAGATLYVGGYFSGIGGQSWSHAAALDTATGKASAAWNPGLRSLVYTLAVSGSTVYLGGKFSLMGFTPRNTIAALDPATGIPAAWDPNPLPDPGSYTPTVDAIAAAGSTVYVGGTFARMGTQLRNNLAALDAATGAVKAWNPNVQGADAAAYADVATIAAAGSRVYVGGKFSRIGGQARSNIAALDAATGQAIAGWNPNANGKVCAIAVSGSTVYVGGLFTSIGGQSRNFIAALDAATGQALKSWNPGAEGWGYDDDGVYALLPHGATLYVGGTFYKINGQDRVGLAALDALTGAAKAWNPNALDVYALAIPAGSRTLYAGGYFSKIGKTERSDLAGIDLVSGLATAWNPGAAGTARALAVGDSALYAGGAFRGFAESDYPDYLAQFDLPARNAAKDWRQYR